MLKDKFTWNVEDFTVEYDSCVGTILDVQLKGITHSCSTHDCYVGPIEADKLLREISDAMNNGSKSIYVARGQGKSLASKVNTIYSPDDEGMAIGMVRKDTGVELECHLEKFIDKVIFNDPATIIIWKDGTKTIVKTQDGDAFDPMVGMAMCIAKKAMGNQGNYFEEFKKWCEPWYAEQRVQSFNECLFTIDYIREGFQKIVDTLGGVKPKKVEDDDIVIGTKRDEVSPKVCMNCRHCFPCINGVGHFCGYGGLIEDLGVKKCSNWEQCESEAVPGQEN